MIAFIAAVCYMADVVLIRLCFVHMCETGLLSADVQACMHALADAGDDALKINQVLEWTYRDHSTEFLRELLLYLRGELTRSYADNVAHYEGIVTPRLKGPSLQAIKNRLYALHSGSD